jgi:hypothetical protein
MSVAEAGLSRAVDPGTFGERPQDMMWLGRTEALALAPDAVATIQLTAVRNRFAHLRERLPVLANLAKEQGIDEIVEIDDAAKLLFKHSVYKSYPVSLIEKNGFDRLTAWLANLTVADLSGVNTDGIESVDDWLDALMRDANVRITHSTGTSGKLSFLPRGPLDGELQLRTTRLAQEVLGKPEPTGLDKVPMVVVGHRIMYNGYGAGLEAMVKDLYHGDESMVVVMDPGRLSADVLSLGGRLASADNRGELGRSQISPAVLKRLDEFVVAQKEAPARRAKFYEIVFDRLSGKRVSMSANWAMYHEMMIAGREYGIENGLFAPDSLILCAGGTKGKVLPEGYQDEICAFLGVSQINQAYGMSEISGLMGLCSAGKYHAPPWMLVLILDPKTGQPSPRSGTHTGRFGVVDLAIQQRWGGILSGDEVTVTFGKCACGLSGPHLDLTIRRYSEMEGGDDKITCAGAPEAHDNALAFLGGVE